MRWRSGWAHSRSRMASTRAAITSFLKRRPVTARCGSRRFPCFICTEESSRGSDTANIAAAPAWCLAGSGHRTNEQFITGISTAGGLPCQDGLWGGHWGHQGFFFGKQDTDIRGAFARKFLPGSTQELDEFAHLQRVPAQNRGRAAARKRRLGNEHEQRWRLRRSD